MNTLDKVILLAAGIVSVLFVGLFFIYTGSIHFSKDPEIWYFSSSVFNGIVGTVFSVAGVYFAFKSLMMTIKTQKKVADFMSSAAPFLVCEASHSSVICKIHNSGTGALDIKKIAFSNSQVFLESVSKTPEDFLKSVGVDKNSTIVKECFKDDKLSVSPNGNIVIINLVPSDLRPSLQDFLDKSDGYYIHVIYYKGVDRIETCLSKLVV